MSWACAQRLPRILWEHCVLMPISCGPGGARQCKLRGSCACRILTEDKAMVEALKPQALQREISVKADLVQTAFRKLREVRHAQLQVPPHVQHACPLHKLGYPAAALPWSAWQLRLAFLCSSAWNTVQRSKPIAQANHTCTNLVCVPRSTWQWGMAWPQPWQLSARRTTDSARSRRRPVH